MDNPKPKYKLSIIPVIIIFLVIYFGEIGIGALLFYKVLIPTFQNLVTQKAIQELNTQKKSNPQTAELLTFYQQMTPTLAKEIPQINKLFESKDYDKVIKTTNDLQSKAKNNADRIFLSLNLAQAYDAKKDAINTQKYAEELISLGPEFSFGYLYMALASLDKKDYKTALDNAKKAVEINSANPYNHYILSITLSWNYQPDEALKEIKKATELDPKNDMYKKELDLQQQQLTPARTNQTTTQSAPAAAPIVYTQDDINQWKAEVDRINTDLATTQKFLNNPSYDQTKMNRLNDLLNQMKTTADKIYNKMLQKQPITNQDNQDIDIYNNLYLEEQKLVKEIFRSS